MVLEAYLRHKETHHTPNNLSEKHEKEEDAIKNLQNFPITYLQAYDETSKVLH